MIDWTPEAIEAAHRAMFQEPYDGKTAAMIGAGLDAAVASQEIPTDSALSEENARLRELLKPFEEAAGKLDDEPVGVGRLVVVTLKDCRAVRDAIRKGGKGE